jgi:hypothetical protein
LSSFTVSRFTIENDDADALKGEEHDHHNGVDDDDIDDVYMDDTYFDEDGRFDLSWPFPAAMTIRSCLCTPGTTPADF